MAKTDYKSIDQYHKSFPADTAERMQKIRDVIHKVTPDVEEAISYQIPCFKHNGYLIYYSAHPITFHARIPFSKKLLEHLKMT